ncbi:MAG TPA: flagellar hook-length control protein FliK [Methylosinus sp.]
MVEPSSSGPSRDSVSELLRSLQSFAAAPSPREARAAAQRSTPSAERRVDADVDSEPAFETSRPSVIDPAPIPSVAEPRRAEGSIARSEPHPASLATISAAPAQAAFDARVDAARIDEEQVIAEPIGRIDLSAPAANPAPAMAALLAPQARSLIAAGQTVEARPGGGATTNAAQGAAPRSGAAAKTLTIEIAPESLGAVVVKMKIAHSGVDMKISVRSQEALHKLETSRAALVDAMQAVGCAIDGCTIQIASTPTPESRTPDGGGFFASSNGAETDRGDRGVAGEGASDGQGSGARRRDTARDDGAADGAPRRSADRRGGGVYL